mmetsp:Transcript_49393/g.138942  ORF Transcript_49393/g.138942 Transcript_49393/m.138942 type:complete len:361 (+) Transcript_49393:346-1428(+)
MLWLLVTCRHQKGLRLMMLLLLLIHEIGHLVLHQRCLLLLLLLGRRKRSRKWIGIGRHDGNGCGVVVVSIAGGSSSKLRFSRRWDLSGGGWRQMLLLLLLSLWRHGKWRKHGLLLLWIHGSSSGGRRWRRHHEWLGHHERVHHRVHVHHRHGSTSTASSAAVGIEHHWNHHHDLFGALRRLVEHDFLQLGRRVFPRLFRLIQLHLQALHLLPPPLVDGSKTLQMSNGASNHVYPIRWTEGKPRHRLILLGLFGLDLLQQRRQIRKLAIHIGPPLLFPTSFALRPSLGPDFILNLIVIVIFTTTRTIDRRSVVFASSSRMMMMMVVLCRHGTQEFLEVIMAKVSSQAEMRGTGRITVCHGQ